MEVSLWEAYDTKWVPEASAVIPISLEPSPTNDVAVTIPEKYPFELIPTP